MQAANFRHHGFVDREPAGGIDEDEIEDGAEAGASFQIDIDAGKVTDVPIEKLATGSYTVTIGASQPIVASARVTSAQGEATDFAWFAAAALLRGTAQLTAAPGPNPVLHLANPSGVDAQVVVSERSGDSTTVAVAAGASALVAVESGATYTLSGFDMLYAAVTLTAGGMVGGYSVHPQGAGSAPIVVYPR